MIVNYRLALSIRQSETEKRILNQNMTER